MQSNLRVISHKLKKIWVHHSHLGIFYVYPRNFFPFPKNINTTRGINFPQC